MKYQIKQLSIFIGIIMLGAPNAYAACNWTHGSLGQTIESTSDRLKLYSECKNDCQQLENELHKTTTLMNGAVECGPSVYNAKNKRMVEFFDSRFQLIRNVKTGKPIRKAPATTTVAIAPKPVVAAAPKPVVIKPTPVKAPETVMNISSEAFQELWLEDGVRGQGAQIAPSQQVKTVQPRVSRQQVQAAQAQAARARAVQAQAAQAKAAQARAVQAQAAQSRATSQQLAQQQKHKQAHIALQNKREAEARKRKILLIQHQERIRQKQLQFERARALHIAKQKARQQR